MASIATSTAFAPSTPRATGRGRYALIGLGTAIAAVLANAVFYYLADLFVAYDPQFLPLTNVSGAIIFTLGPAIVAPIIYAILLRFTRHPVGIFRAIAAVVFVVTTIPDFTYIPTVPGATAAQTAVLVLMHIVAALVITGMLTRLARPQER